MVTRLLMRLFIALSIVVVVAGLAWVYAVPPASMRVTRDGVPHLSPPVAHPVSGEAVALELLVQHYKSGGR
ncbi:MAG: hypothetical protein KJZ83_17620 [Burkholderiaceae bacterium]|nr:hypothetical protein [Burkholderiaceae bacterium]